MYVKDIVIDLVNPPTSWEKFSLLGNNKIALDGYVSGGPKKDLRFKIFNFNHHENVPRLETRATCAQVLIAIRQGITELFSADVDNSVTVYVNDCDEDVCLSVFLLRYPHLVRNTINPAINRLVHIEDMLDTTAGAYPLPDDLPFLEDLAWIYAPYRSARRLGVLGLRDVDAYREVIETVGERIKLYILGNGSKIKLDTRFNIIDPLGGFGGFIHEVGSDARLGFYSKGYNVFLSQKGTLANGRAIYSVGKRSDYIPFSLSLFCELANAEEGLTDSADKWGGGSTIVGSPRTGGSGLNPKQLMEIAKKCIL